MVLFLQAGIDDFGANEHDYNNDKLPFQNENKTSFPDGESNPGRGGESAES